MHSAALVAMLISVCGCVDVPQRMTDHVPGNLIITVIKAYNLPDTDGWLNTADPYAKVMAFRSDNPGHTLYTENKGGTLNPVWNTELMFGEGQWTHFNIQILDSDGGSVYDYDIMTASYRVDILTPCSKDVEKINNQIEYSYYVDYTY